jgi:5-methylcytosine-specific restriction endonuclease McrA
MTSLPKSPRLRLDDNAYQQLRLQVLERDGWRCQVCGSMMNLEVHHAQFRSRQGQDSEDNLITLCVQCHKFSHG